MTAPLVLRNPDMLLLWIGQLASQAGTQMYRMALLWWILTASPGGSGLEVGLLMVFGAIPSLAFVKPIGRLVERTDSQRLLVSCDLIASGVVGVVTALLYSGALTVWAAYAASFLTASVHAVFDPTLNKAVPRIVAPEDMQAAVAFQSSTQSLASFGGAVAGAVLVEQIGIPAVALANAVSYLVSALCIVAIRFRPAPEAMGSGIARDLSALAVLDAMPLVKRYLIGFGMVNFFTVPTLVVLPVYTYQTLQASPSTLGALEASLWLGLLAGAFSSRVVDRIRRPSRVAALCLFTLGTCLFVPGVYIHRETYILLLFIAGMALGVNNVKFIALFQKLVPPEAKGRFFAVLQAAVGFTFPVAYAVFGMMAKFLPPPQVCLVQGVGTMAVALYFLSLGDAQ